MRVDGAFVRPLLDYSRSLDRELNDLFVGALLRRMRQALLDGHSLDVPRIGELTVRQARPYALVNQWPDPRTGRRADHPVPSRPAAGPRPERRAERSRCRLITGAGQRRGPPDATAIRRRAGTKSPPPKTRNQNWGETK
jgi:hypothetical protein